MRKVSSILSPVLELVKVKEKRIADIGCSTGDVVRWLTEQGASVTGVDTAEMIEKARSIPPQGDEIYLVGRGEAMPLDNESTDIVLFIASLHHVPEALMETALKEAWRILTEGGDLLVLEPIINCTYYRIVRLVEEETEIRKRALNALSYAESAGFRRLKEDHLFVERTFSDYEALLDLFFKGTDQEKENVLNAAKALTKEMAREAGCELEAFRYQSACALFHFQKV